MWNWISALEEARRRGIAAVLVTVVRTTGSVPRGVGAKMLVHEDGSALGTVGGGLVERRAIEDAVHCLATGQSRNFSYVLTPRSGQCCGGRVELFMDVLNVWPRLTIFGAGHVGFALAQVLQTTIFEVELVDDRAERLANPDLPDQALRHCNRWQEFLETAKWHPARSYVAIMMPTHAQDIEILEQLLPLPLRYLGMIGSRSKWKRFRQHLLEQGLPSEQLDRVRCPIGVGPTGKSPGEIAISIAAEVLMDHYGYSCHSTDFACSGQIRASWRTEGPAPFSEQALD